MADILQSLDVRSDPVEAQLWSALREQNDSSAQAALVERYIPFVRAIAYSIYRSMNPNYVDLRDLQQLGSVGLIEAIARFDPQQGTSFQQFAGARVRGAILNGLPDLSELHAQQAFRRRKQKERLDSLKPSSLSDPQPDTFAGMVELTLGLAIGYMLEGTHMYADDESEHSGYADSSELVAAADSFNALIEGLPDTQHKIVEFHYLGGLDFSEIAHLLALSKGRVSQLHRVAIASIRKAFGRRAEVDLRV